MHTHSMHSDGPVGLGSDSRGLRDEVRALVRSGLADSLFFGDARLGVFLESLRPYCRDRRELVVDALMSWASEPREDLGAEDAVRRILSASRLDYVAEVHELLHHLNHEAHPAAVPTQDRNFRMVHRRLMARPGDSDSLASIAFDEGVEKQRVHQIVARTAKRIQKDHWKPAAIRAARVLEARAPFDERGILRDGAVTDALGAELCISTFVKGLQLLGVRCEVKRLRLANHSRFGRVFGIPGQEQLVMDFWSYARSCDGLSIYDARDHLTSLCGREMSIDQVVRISECVQGFEWVSGQRPALAA